jgi:YidC/Oxa1 family membrane protein insertase
VDRNFFLAMALSFLVLVVWSMYAEQQQPVESEGPVVTAPEDPARELIARDQPTPVAVEPAMEAGPTAEAERVAAPSQPERRVTISSPLYEAEFTSHGGGLVRWDLLQYQDRFSPGEPPVRLTTLDQSHPLALATPFDELGFGDQSRADYQLHQPDSRTVQFTREQDGVLIRKTYTLDEEQYWFRLRIEVENGSERYVRPTFRTIWPAVQQDSADFQQFTLSAFVGDSLEQAGVGGGGGFFLFGGAGGLEQTVVHAGDVDWAGAQTRYFLKALVPDVPRDASVRFTPVTPGHSALTEVAFTPVDVPPGQRLEREYRVYLGPKETELLDAAGSHLDEAILKGWFPALTRFFTWLLTATYSMVGNYGVAIVIITILVRALMAPIMTRQMRSMKRLSKLQPKIKEVQEKYPDKQQQSEAMMAVYKEAGMSPFSAMAGCFPMLLQLPVFIGFYYALQGAIQLRQQPFIGWINDLSEPEQLFVIPGLELPVRLLPLLMGGSMVLQQKLTPTTMDPAQARMMLTVMPVMFTMLFYQFASGLVLYWLVSNLLGIAQQAYTNRTKDA